MHERRKYGSPGVLLSHPARQHSWATARALQRAGLLQAFVTSIDYEPRRFPYPLLDLLPPHMHARFRTELSKRAVRIDDRSVVHTPGLWPLLPAAGRLVATGRTSRKRLNRLIDITFDRWVSGELPKVLPQALHCFEGSALRSFARARQLNIPRVLDVASDHTGYLQVLQQERQALRDSGLLHRAKRKDEAVHSEVYAERALADYLLVPSECVRQALLADGVPDHKIVMMPYGVDTSHFVPTAAPRPATKPFTVLFVGTLLLGKGLQYLLRAWAELGLDDAVLLIVGGDGERLAESLRVSCGRNVEWAGNVSSSQMLAYYHRADVFVFPSLSDAFGLVVAEAMACGLPVITTSTAGASSIILDGINGYIVPPRDVSALKEKIAAFHCDEAMRRRMGQQARGRVVQSYTWEHYEQRLAAFYRTVVLGDTAKSICGENVALVTAL